jgi:cellulose synthase/poly-beta-1,6-N-acetylglucosamine synthase-like glycosyltransferase
MTPPGAPSPAALARRPILTPGVALLTILLTLGASILGIETACVRGLGAYAAPSLLVAVFFVAYDLATGVVLLCAARARLVADRAARLLSTVPDRAPSASVLIAAYNEASVGGTGGLVATVRGIVAQGGLTLEILVGDDGSEDATYAEVVGAFSLRPCAEGHAGVVIRADGVEVSLRAFRFPHAGKGATLNALAACAVHEVLITMDADTSPAKGALAHLAAAFLDRRVESAAGVVSVRNAASVLTRHQYAEYVKNSIVRIGWSALGALEQVPGAFAGIRASAFRAVGGFPTDSLTEDYELTYRLVARGMADGHVPLVVTVPLAQAFTDVPATFRGFVRQRTRWFAGFLSTLFRFRHLIGRPGAGGFGVVRLPLKLVDAVLPLLAFASLVVIVHGAASPVLALSKVAVGIFLIRWAWDLVFYAVALSLARSLGDPVETRRVAPERWRGWLCTATEALTYIWLKHASVLRAYAWAARRVRTWEPSRESLAHEGHAGSSERVAAMVGSPPCAPPSVPS